MAKENYIIGIDISDGKDESVGFTELVHNIAQFTPNPHQDFSEMVFSVSAV